MLDFNPIKKTDIVFLGDSLTESFDLKKHFGRNDLRNRGMSGNMTEHVLYRLEEITNAAPWRLFFMIGINDIYQGSSSDVVYDNIVEILSIVRERCPYTEIFFQSILPVNEERLLTQENINTSIYSMNDRLQAYCKTANAITYIDLHSEFLNNSGEMDSKYTYDGVHLTAVGYVRWAELVGEFL